MQTQDKFKGKINIIIIIIIIPFDLCGNLIAGQNFYGPYKSILSVLSHKWPAT